MENRILISRESLEFMTRTLLDFWEYDAIELSSAKDRKIAKALDEAITELELQEEFDNAKAAEMEANRLAWEAKLKADKN